jgi:hypothetical protein
MKMCSLGAILFHLDARTDRQTDGRQMDMTKLVVLFVCLFFLFVFFFTNVPKSQQYILHLKHTILDSRTQESMAYIALLE